MAFGDFFKGIGRGIATFTPGRQLARGLGITFALPGIKRQQEETFLKEQELQNKLLERYKEARNQGDKDRMKRLERTLKDFKFSNALSTVLEDAPTNTQVLASAGELALLATLGYRPRTGLKPFQLGRATKVPFKSLTKTQKYLRTGKTLAKEVGIGAGVFSLSELVEKEDADLNDVIKAAEMGAIAGPLTIAGTSLVAKGIGFTFKNLKGPTGRLWNKAISSLEKAAEPTTKGTTQIDKTLSYIGETFKQRTAKGVLGTISQARRAEQRLLDRFSPAKRIERKISETTGRPLKEAEKIHRDMRQLVSLSDDAAERAIDGYLTSLKPYKDVLPQSKAWIAQLDFIDRARLGKKVPGNQSLDDLTTGLIKMTKEIGPENMKRVAQVRNITHSFNDKLLQDRVNAGLITQELADFLRKTHPNYIPHNVIIATDEKVAQGLSQSLNVAKTDIMKAVGSAKNIDDPFVATMQRAYIAERTMAKNKLLNNIVDIVEETPDVIPGMRKIKTTEKATEGFDTINLFRKGIKETWVVPKDLAIAIKGLDTPLMPGWARLLTFPQRVLKKGATQYNLSFALPNKFRDKQTAYLTAGSFIEDLVKKYGIAKNPIDISKLSTKEVLDLYSKSGGYGASIFKEGESKILNKMERTGMAKVMSSANPGRIIDATNSRLEVSTRLGVFKNALARGLSPQDAAFAAREATIDFAKMGTWMRPANQAIPFLNARIQGFANLPRALVKSPETFARMQLYTVVYPTLLLHQHNRRFDSYKDISQYYKDKYWVIMTGETTTFDSYSGDEILVPQFVTIPKGEGQTLVSGPIQHFLDKSDGNDYRKTSQMIADVVGSASPLEFQTFNGGNVWLSGAAQLGPLVSIPVGLASNKQPYFGSQIIPEERRGAEKRLQFSSGTPEVIKDIGNILNISPAEIEFVLDSFGGLSQDIQNITDLIYGVVRNGKIGLEPITETPFGYATKTPLSRRFLRESRPFYSPEMEFRKEQKKEIEEETTSERLLIKDKAIEIIEEMNRLGTDEEKLNYLNSLGDELTTELKEQIKGINNSRESVEVLKKSDPVDVRAAYILQRLQEMKDIGMPTEDIVTYLNELEDKEILTKSVKQEIIKLK